MTWLHRLQAESAIRLARTGLPRRVLRHLIFSHEAGVGSQVLDAGCGHGELVRFFDQLGFRATGLDESPAQVASARRLAPHLEFHCFEFHGLEFHGLEFQGLEFQGEDVAHAIPFAEHQFDLVIVRGLDVYRDDLFSNEAFSTTAQLLSCVRPHGHLVFLEQMQSGDDNRKGGHSASCFARHLSSFPGTCSTADFPYRRVQDDAWGWVLGRQRGVGVMTATFRCPIEAMSKDEWLDLVVRAVAAHSKPCCHNAGVTTTQPPGEQQVA